MVSYRWWNKIKINEEIDDLIYDHIFKRIFWHTTAEIFDFENFFLTTYFLKLTIVQLFYRPKGSYPLGVALFSFYVVQNDIFVGTEILRKWKSVLSFVHYSKISPGWSISQIVTPYNLNELDGLNVVVWAL